MRHSERLLANLASEIDVVRTMVHSGCLTVSTLVDTFGKRPCLARTNMSESFSTRIRGFPGKLCDPYILKSAAEGGRHVCNFFPSFFYLISVLFMCYK